MTMPTLSDVILGLAVMVAVPVEGIPHQGQMGGKVVGLPPGRHVPPKAEDARIVSVQEFQQLSVADRRGILAAWLEKGPLTAGEALLPIVKVAVNDADAEVRMQGLGLFRKFDGALNRAALAGTSDPISRQAFADVQRFVISLIPHPDATFRRAVLHALGPTASAQPELVEDALLKRLPDEHDDGARAAIIAALAETVRNASSKGRPVVLDALHDTRAAVRLSAVTGVARFHAPEAIPALMSALDAGDPILRAAAARSIGSQGAAARNHLSALRIRLEQETHPAVRRELSRTLKALGGGG
jgi:HEAT repeat protein